jgi:2Fe-2S ferredoxin
MILRVRLPDGSMQELEALEGWRVMEIIRDWGLPIRAECGGASACGTCLVHVDDDWLDKLYPPQAEELDQLDVLFDVRRNARLSCQILMSPELDGLTVTLAPEALAGTTAWAA